MALSGCASLQLDGLFQGYSQQMKPVKQALQRGDVVQATLLLKEKDRSHNAYTLNLLERARLQFLSSNWQESQLLFEQAYQQIELERNKAKIQVSRGIEKLGAVVSNDNAISYQAALYEQSMLHSYQALNFAFQGQLSSALVEIRRANLVQEQALASHEQALNEATDKLINSGIHTSSIYGRYPNMSSAIGNIKNGFQNAFTFYLSGILYEASGNINDAYIDYKRAIEIYPDNEYLQRDVIRLAHQLGMNDDLTVFEQRFGSYKAKTIQQQGKVVFLIERGIVESKQETGLNLPVRRSNGDIKFLSFSLPVYRESLALYSPVSIEVGHRKLNASEIVRLQSLAAKNLEENIPDILTRQVVRVLAKEQLRQKLSKEAGDVGNILASIYNIASEKADTRSWSTLPDEVDIVSTFLSAGKQSLAVNVNGITKTIDLDIKANRTTLIKMTTLSNETDFQVITL